MNNCWAIGMHKCNKKMHLRMQMNSFFFFIFSCKADKKRLLMDKL